MRLPCIKDFNSQNLTASFEEIHKIINATIADQRLHSKLIGKESRILSPELADALTNKFNEFYDSIIDQVKKSPTLNISQFLSNLQDISGVEVKTIDVRPILKKFGIIDETLIEKIQTTFNKNTTEVVNLIKQVNLEANQTIIKERFTDIILRTEFKTAAEFAPQLQEIANEIGKTEYAAFYSDFLNKTVEEIIQNSVSESNSKARIYLDLFGKTSTPTKLHEDTYMEFASEIFLEFARNNSHVIDKLHQIIQSGEYDGNEVQNFKSEINEYISNNQLKVKEILAKTYLSELIAKKYLSVNTDLEKNTELQERLSQEIIKKLKNVSLEPNEVNKILENMQNLKEKDLQNLNPKEKIQKYFETMLDGVDTTLLANQLKDSGVFNIEGLPENPIATPEPNLNPRIEDPIIIEEPYDPIYDYPEYTIDFY